MEIRVGRYVLDGPLALLVGLEGLALTLTGLWLALATALTGPERLAAALFEVFAALLVGVVLTLASMHVVRSVHWRSPVLLVNLLALPVTVSLAQSGQWWLAIPLGAIALAVIFLLARKKPLT